MRYIVNDKIRRIDIDDESKDGTFRRETDIVGDAVGNGMFPGFRERYGYSTLAVAAGVFFAVNDDADGLNA